ncbi:uncharacterized protein LOC121695012 [Scomber scombrus]|uniref:Uncharacterized protein LOC121695012 n=1 Tax=Scomber scombrus TaxID=13677 RepID=A0AAV1N4G0_SCOSC
MKDYWRPYVDPVRPSVVRKYLHPRLCNPNLDGCDLSVVQQHYLGLEHTPEVTDDQAINIEACTRKQLESSTWFVSWVGRITSSNSRAVRTTNIDKPALSAVNKVCNPYKQVVTLDTRWGLTHEEQARKVYITRPAKHHVNLKVAHYGFVINPLPQAMAATVKRYTHNEHHHSCHTLKKSFCFHTADGSPDLKRNQP